VVAFPVVCSSDRISDVTCNEVEPGSFCQFLVSCSTTAL